MKRPWATDLPHPVPPVDGEVCYVGVNLLLPAIDLADDSGNWWFFWPLLGWGIGLAAHAATTFGGAWEERKARQLTPTAVPAAPSGAPDHVEPAQLVEQAEARVAKLWRLARLIPSPPVRDQAFRVCAAADRIAEAMAANPPDAQTVRWFLERFLVPTEAVLDRYVRLATRDVPAAGPTLARVETHDLPLLEAKLDEFYERLHRGDLIDLEVASQMLAFDLETAPPKPSRPTAP